MPDIRIRDFQAGDAEAIYELFNGPRAMAGTLQVPWTSLDARRRRAERDDPDTRSGGDH